MRGTWQQLRENAPQLRNSTSRTKNKQEQRIKHNTYAKCRVHKGVFRPTIVVQRRREAVLPSIAWEWG
jgi:hypothetical protein